MSKAPNVNIKSLNIYCTLKKFIYLSGILTLFIYTLIIILVAVVIIKKIKNNPKFNTNKLLLIYILSCDIIISIVIELIDEHNFTLMLLQSL